MTTEIFDTNVDDKNRRIYLFGEINEESAKKTIIALHSLDSSEGEIELYIDSLGGVDQEGLAIYDTIKLCKNDITVIGTGSVQSMAAAIFQAGKNRYLTKNCRFMVHNGIIGYEGTVNEFLNLSKETVELNKLYVKILAERSTLSELKIKRLCSKDSYMSAEKAVELGFADKIL